MGQPPWVSTAPSSTYEVTEGKRTVGVVADADHAVSAIDVGHGDGNREVGLRDLQPGPEVGDGGQRDKVR
jgi:hypothetical protein